LTIDFIAYNNKYDISLVLLLIYGYANIYIYNCQYL